jgi:hypothetical protein
MHLNRHVRRVVTVAATATFFLGAGASLAYADQTTAPGQYVGNYGHCVSNDIVNPSDGTTGPATVNKNNTNVPHDPKGGAHVACAVA